LKKVRQNTLTSFKSIEEIIKQEEAFAGLRQTVKKYDVVEEFEKIFPELSVIAKAIKMEKQILFLRVENAVWKSELNFQKKVLIYKINKHFGEEVVKSIKFI
jgi:hypothetical protein